jgi:molecular chaperone GrpE
MSSEFTPDDRSGAGEAAPADQAATAPSEVERERDELRDRLLRTAAEFDNYRKRVERERREQMDLATADLARDLLPVVDDLERALDACTVEDGDTRLAAFRTGVEMVHRQFLETLRRRNIEPIETVGTAFDPMWHEAIATEPAGDRPDGEITGEIRRGYRIGERLLRAALVRVAKA